MGFTPVLAGEILYWGKPYAGANRAWINQRVGWVISQKEHYPLFSNIDSLFKNIAPLYPTWNWSLCDRLCTEFKLDRNKRLLQLSLGEQSKVRLIKALSFEPSLVVLDELTANLSPSSKQALLESILGLFASKPMSILYISHSNEEAVQLSDRILELKTDGFHVVGGQNV